MTIQVMPGWRYVNADTQESKMMREAYVAFPIILYGTGVKPELITTPVTVDCIAPTLSKALRIRAPNACTRAPLL